MKKVKYTIIAICFIISFGMLSRIGDLLLDMLPFAVAWAIRITALAYIAVWMGVNVADAEEEDEKTAERED